MKQKHSLIFWAKAGEESFDEAAERAYELMQSLMACGDAFYPKYRVCETGYNEPFDWNFDHFKQALREGSNREGVHEFLDLGFSIHFVSSRQPEHRVSINLTVGMRNPRFQNTLILSLPAEFPLENESGVRQAESVFRIGIEKFRPYWAAIVNAPNKRRKAYKGLDLSQRIHWVNYWDTARIARIGTENMSRAPIFETEKQEEGCIVKLQRYPIDDESLLDLDKQKAAQAFFDGF